MLERDVQKKSIDYAKRQGWWCRKFRTQGRRSAPDYIMAKRGHVVFVEFKATGEHPTELQIEEHKQMQAAGLIVWMYDNPVAFKSALTLFESRWLT